MNQGRAEDVLERHHQNNGHPSAPVPEQLTLLAQRSQTETVPKTRAPRNSKKAKDATPSAGSLAYYHPTWKDCLEDAKRECRASHALHNPFPSKARDLDISISESLVTVVVEWTNRGTAFAPGMYTFDRLCFSRTHSDLALGYWPEHKRDMAVVVRLSSTTSCSLIPISSSLATCRLGVQNSRRSPSPTLQLRSVSLLQMPLQFRRVLHGSRMLRQGCSKTLYFSEMGSTTMYVFYLRLA